MHRQVLTASIPMEFCPNTLLLGLATVALTTVSYAQSVVPFNDFFQVRYASNLNKGDSYVNITNTGSDDGTVRGDGDNICVNVYTFDPRKRWFRAAPAC